MTYQTNSSSRKVYYTTLWYVVDGKNTTQKFTQQQQPLNGPLCRTIWMSQYQNVGCRLLPMWQPVAGWLNDSCPGTERKPGAWYNAGPSQQWLESCRTSRFVWSKANEGIHTEDPTGCQLIWVTIVPTVFYARCFSYCNLPNLSWLGTGTKLCWTAYSMACLHKSYSK